MAEQRLIHIYEMLEGRKGVYLSESKQEAFWIPEGKMGLVIAMGHFDVEPELLSAALHVAVKERRFTFVDVTEMFEG